MKNGQCNNASVASSEMTCTISWVWGVSGAVLCPLQLAVANRITTF